MVAVARMCYDGMAQTHQNLVFQDVVSFVSCLLAFVAELIDVGPFQLTMSAQHERGCVSCNAYLKSSMLHCDQAVE